MQRTKKALWESKSTKLDGATRMVTAGVNMANEEKGKEFVKWIRLFCKGRLQLFQIPQQLSAPLWRGASLRMHG